jgi:DNA-binding transcriptional regulator YiaG
MGTGAEEAELMTAEEFREGLQAIGYSQQRFAALIGATPRTGQKWALGETRIPGSVAILLRLFVAHPKTLAAVEKMPPLPTRERSAPRRRRSKGGSNG